MEVKTEYGIMQLEKEEGYFNVYHNGNWIGELHKFGDNLKKAIETAIDEGELLSVF